MVLLPKPVGPNPKVQRINENKARAATKRLTNKIAEVLKTDSNLTWPGNSEDVGPVALQKINGLLQSRKLKLVGFHADKVQEQANVTLVPFVISVDGGFNNVMAFARDLEKPNTKFVVHLFQVSNADQSSDKVTASIGVTAYQLPLAALTDTSAVKILSSPPKTTTQSKKEVKKNA